MDLTVGLYKILTSVAHIDKGQKDLRTGGQEHEGRLYYEKRSLAL